MNDEKINVIISPRGYGKCYKEYKKVIEYLEKLQSNWNSLREWLKDLIIYEETEDSTYYIESIQVLQDVLYKMNELEGKDKNEN